MSITASEFKAACLDVIAAAEKSAPSALIQYAATYAKAGLKMSDLEEMRVQCLYIENNLRGWRGPDARAVKALIREGGKGITI